MHEEIEKYNTGKPNPYNQSPENIVPNARFFNSRFNWLLLKIVVLGLLAFAANGLLPKWFAILLIFVAVAFFAVNEFIKHKDKLTKPQYWIGIVIVLVFFAGVSVYSFNHESSIKTQEHFVPTLSQSTIQKDSLQTQKQDTTKNAIEIPKPKKKQDQYDTVQRLKERAYLKLFDIKTSFDKINELDIQFAMINMGQTPASQVSYIALTRIGNSTDPEAINVPQNMPYTKAADIPPRDKMAWITPKKPFPLADSVRIFSGSDTLFVYANVRYVDFCGVHDSTGFLLFYEKERKSFFVAADTLLNYVR